MPSDAPQSCDDIVERGDDVAAPGALASAAFKRVAPDASDAEEAPSDDGEQRPREPLERAMERAMRLRLNDAPLDRLRRRLRGEDQEKGGGGDGGG
ncbi:MAG: hypothetical protein ACFB00_02250 [Parvularculaceae bacterium]